MGMIHLIFQFAFIATGIVTHDVQFFYIAGIFAIAESIAFVGACIRQALIDEVDADEEEAGQLSLFQKKMICIPEEKKDEAEKLIEQLRSLDQDERDSDDKA